jgi:segregation and condensation protein B
MSIAESMAEGSFPVPQLELDQDCVVEQHELSALIEALLLVAPEPASVRELAQAAGVPVAVIEDVLLAMQTDSVRGWAIVRHNETVHLASAPRFARYVRRFLGLERETKLSGAALETLALIAYRQPVTRAEVEALRGVDSSAVLATLHARGLIEIAGRLPTVGNPNQYVTSVEFLRQFGLASLDELPPLDELLGRGVDHVFAELSAPDRQEHAEHP